MIEKLEFWTDGSYRSSVDTGGIGVVVVQDGRIIDKISERYEHTTNNQMEILAIDRALQYIYASNTVIKTVDIYTDSQYCLGILNKSWKITKNKELWDTLIRNKNFAQRFCQNIKFHFTKGHDSDELNNMADRLATDASGYTTPVEDKQPKQVNKPKQMIIALDFDGTVVKHRYPEIGEDIGSVPVLHALQAAGHQFILYTMRDNHSSGRNCLKEATDWFQRNHINLIGVNCNPWQKSWTDSIKVYAPLYIDDAALGAPLKKDSPNERPYIDWGKCLDYFVTKGLLTDTQAMAANYIRE